MFRQGFTCPALLVITQCSILHTGLSPTMAGLSRPFCYTTKGFRAASRSLVATEEISVDFFSSGYLDISVPRVRLCILCIQIQIPLKRWVSPFGHPRIKACCQLPEAYRRLPRPSSPPAA